MSSKSGPQSVIWALFSLKGRIRRSTYGLGIALIFCVWWVALAQMFAVQESSDQYGLWALILGLVALGSLYCIYALCHKRVQDIGKPGHYALLVVLMAFLSSFFLIVPLVLLGVLKGEDKPNRFGTPPVQ